MQNITQKDCKSAIFSVYPNIFLVNIVHMRIYIPNIGSLAHS